MLVYRHANPAAHFQLSTKWRLQIWIYFFAYIKMILLLLLFGKKKRTRGTKKVEQRLHYSIKDREWEIREQFTFGWSTSRIINDRDGFFFSPSKWDNEFLISRFLWMEKRNSIEARDDELIYTSSSNNVFWSVNGEGRVNSRGDCCVRTGLSKNKKSATTKSMEIKLE